MVDFYPQCHPCCWNSCTPYAVYEVDGLSTSYHVTYCKTFLSCSSSKPLRCDSFTVFFSILMNDFSHCYELCSGIRVNLVWILGLAWMSCSSCDSCESCVHFCDSCESCFISWFVWDLCSCCELVCSIVVTLLVRLSLGWLLCQFWKQWTVHGPISV